MNGRVASPRDRRRSGKADIQALRHPQLENGKPTRPITRCCSHYHISTSLRVSTSGGSHETVTGIRNHESEGLQLRLTQATGFLSVRSNIFKPSGTCHARAEV